MDLKGLLIGSASLLTGILKFETEFKVGSSSEISLQLIAVMESVFPSSNFRIDE